MRLGIRQKAKLFEYLQNLDWEREPEPSYFFHIGICSYIATDRDNKLVYRCEMVEDYGLYGTEKKYKIEITSPGSSSVEEIKGRFAKKVFDWIKGNTYVVREEIKQMEEDAEEEDRIELEATVKSLIK
jgi:hypothetical protein